jgi:hypothetical protein
MGIGISDFGKRDRDGIQSMLDTRTFVDFNERFSYLNLLDQEVQLYINKLCNHDPPILKEITVFDYGFLYFVDDSTQPDSIRLERESPFIYAQNTIRLSFNINNSDDDKLPIIHETVYDTHQDRISSRILLDVNSEKAKKLLGLDTLYSWNNNFSISIWGEIRYIIVDPILREFIEICNVMFEAVCRKMEQHYSLSLLSKDVRREYIKWYQSIYGTFRRGAETLRLDGTSVSRIRQRIKKIRRLERQGNNEEIKKIMEELDYACRFRMWGPYEKRGNLLNNKDFTPQDLESIERRLELIDKNLYRMIYLFDRPIEKYHNELMSQKYGSIRQRYSIITEPMLNISYPSFLRKLLKRRL